MENVKCSVKWKMLNVVLNKFSVFMLVKTLLYVFCPHFGVCLPEVRPIDKLFPTRTLMGEFRFIPHHVEYVETTESSIVKL